MQKIALLMFYNNQEFVWPNLSNHYDIFDKIVIFEGNCAINNQASHSSDQTINEIKRFIDEKDYKKKIKLICEDYRKQRRFGSREELEGFCKQQMLLKAEPESGDICVLIDCDEFHNPESLFNEIETISKNEKIKQLVLEEYQFVYSLNLFVKASHESRVWRFIKGSHYTNSNHIIYPNGEDISKDYTYIIPREQSKFFHLSYFQHPLKIKDKVLTFAYRSSFVDWYNGTYLIWPSDPQRAYNNNKRLSQKMGWAAANSDYPFLEGQVNTIESFGGESLDCLKGFKDLDYRDYIIKNRESLTI